MHCVAASSPPLHAPRPRQPRCVSRATYSQVELAPAGAAVMEAFKARVPLRERDLFCTETSEPGPWIELAERLGASHWAPPVKVARADELVMPASGTRSRPHSDWAK